MAAQDPLRENSIGFVGLGDMGGPIAHRIAAAGFPLAVWSRGVHSLRELGEQPFIAVPSLRELGNSCGIVAICVFGDADVRDVVLGTDGVLAAMSPDSILLIHSTVSVDLCCEIADAGVSRGVHVMDAPVSGARAGAVSGTLTIMIGGDPSLRNRVTPLLKSYGRLIQWMGPVGSGQKMKVLNNVLGFATGQIASIAIETGVALGLDPASLIAVLQSGSAASFALHSLVHNMIPDTVFAAHASAMIAKDTELFQQVCRRDELSPTVLEQLAVDRTTHPVPDVPMKLTSRRDVVTNNTWPARSGFGRLDQSGG